MLFMKQNLYLLYNTNHYHFHKKNVYQRNSWAVVIQSTPHYCIPLASILISSFYQQFDFSWGFRSSAILMQHTCGSCLPTFRYNPLVSSLKSIVRDCLLLNCISLEVWNLLRIYLSILVDFCAFIFFRTLHLSTIPSVLVLCFTKISLYSFCFFVVHYIVGSCVLSTCDSLMYHNNVFDIGLPPPFF